MQRVSPGEAGSDDSPPSRAAEPAHGRRQGLVVRRSLLLAAALCLTGYALGIPPAPAAAPAPGTSVVVTLGDSVPAGTACGCTPFPDLYADMLSPAARSIDLARPGYAVGDVAAQIADPGARVSLADATVVVVMAGANDMADVFDDGDAALRLAAQQVRTTMAAIVTEVREEHGSPVRMIVVGYWNVVKDGPVGLAAYGPAGVRSAQLATQYGNDALRQAAEWSGATFVTTGPAFKGSDESGDPASLLAADGDHPNAAGHRAIARTIYAAAPAR